MYEEEVVDWGDGDIYASPPAMGDAAGHGFTDLHQTEGRLLDSELMAMDAGSVGGPAMEEHSRTDDACHGFVDLHQMDDRVLDRELMVEEHPRKGDAPSVSPPRSVGKAHTGSTLATPLPP